jgi:hypothetical protein
MPPEFQFSVDKEKYKRLIQQFFESFKALEKELTAHQMVILSLKTQFSDLDESLEVARNSPLLERQMYEKYDVVLEKLLKLIDEAAADQDLFRLFQEWKPKGPIQ